jgi:hypothetical protein
MENPRSQMLLTELEITGSSILLPGMQVSPWRTWSSTCWIPEFEKCNIKESISGQMVTAARERREGGTCKKD